MTGTIKRTLAVAPMTAVLALGAVACGTKDYTNAPRPPDTMQLGATINSKAVRAAPASFGAGPIRIVIANQTSATRELTIETQMRPGGNEPGIKQVSGPINAQGTATLSVNLPEGTYVLTANASGIAPATIDVGPSRPTGNTSLLLP